MGESVSSSKTTVGCGGFVELIHLRMALQRGWQGLWIFDHWSSHFGKVGRGGSRLTCSKWVISKWKRQQHGLQLKLQKIGKRFGCICRIWWWFVGGDSRHLWQMSVLKNFPDPSLKISRWNELSKMNHFFLEKRTAYGSLVFSMP